MLGDYMMIRRVQTAEDRVQPRRAYLVWITNLLHDSINFIDGKFLDLSIHPVKSLNPGDELLLDIGHDLVTQILCLG
jgi:hypothetical protein